MQKICLVDFDNSLIKLDSLVYITKQEKLYLKPNLFFKGVLLFFAFLLPKKNQIFFRSIYKKSILFEIKKISEDRKNHYIKYFQKQINFFLLDLILRQKYDKIIIISASEKNIIKQTLEGVVKYDKIIANNFNKLKNFVSCWNFKKLECLEEYLGNLDNYEFELYTDSFDDLPLMEISHKTYIINGNKYYEVDKKYN